MKTDSEHAHQVTFVNWFRDKYPDCLIFAIPNGEIRAISVAKRLKSEGVVSGIPDLCCLMSGGITLWIEMKKEKGSRISNEQKEIHSKMMQLGHRIEICKGYQEAINHLSNI